MTQPFPEVLADADVSVPTVGLTPDDAATQYEAILKTFHGVRGADKKDLLREVLADRVAEGN